MGRLGRWSVGRDHWPEELAEPQSIPSHALLLSSLSLLPCLLPPLLHFLLGQRPKRALICSDGGEPAASRRRANGLR